jgi:hypothetical protein
MIRTASNKHWATITLLLGVELDNELFVDVLGDIGALGVIHEFTAEGGSVPFEPRIVVGTGSEVVGDDFERFGTLTNRNDIANTELVGGDVDNVSVDSYVAVGHKLAGLSTAAGNAETIDHVVKTGFNEFHELFTGNATTTGGFGIKLTELTLKDTISIFGFLLLLKLDAIFRNFATATVLTVHTRSIRFLFVVLIRTVDGFVELSCYFGFRTCISCHYYLSDLKMCY